MATPKSTDHAALGAALRTARNDKELTLEELEQLVVPKMKSRYISACERGEVNLSFANLLRLCRALEVSVASVIADYERRVSAKP
jgi:transcriptional regulator with XRE-family HTH domain